MNHPDRLMSSCFAEFYQELSIIKQAASRGELVKYLGGKGSGSDLAGSASARLLGLLAEQKQRIDEGANHMESRSYSLARYFMAALADEILGLNLDWKGRDYWREHLIEEQLFGHAVAGRNFYLLADRVLHSRGHNPIMEDLAAVALMSIQLGFQGQYKGASGKEKRDRYRQRLIHFIGVGKEQGGRLRPIFAKAYQNLLASVDESRLAPFSRWYFIGVVMLAAYLLLSTAVWIFSIQNLNSILPYQGMFDFFTNWDGG
jgi:type VI secretion system protein ImpK